MISNKMQSLVANSSIIRAMFDEGKRLAKIYGAENVYDFSLGNPNVEPPKVIKDSIKEILDNEVPNYVHGYMNNSGFEDVRTAIAAHESKKNNMDLSFESIVMTVGAAGGLNIVFKTLLNPGDEVITFAPFFGEYKSYAANYDAHLVVVAADIDTFEPNIDALKSAITPKTKIVIVNSPNNPTGVIYSDSALAKLADVLREKEKEYGIDIFLVSDEPYREIVYDDVKVPCLLKYYKNTIVGYSYSKSLSLPGERIGYLVVHPEIVDFDDVMSSLNVANRILGFVNAPSLFQRVVAKNLNAEVDVNIYKKNRDALYNHLISIGFECVKPQGAFYLFPRSPIADEKKFCEDAKQFNLLLVPGSAFGCPGHFRISYCISYDKIIKSLPEFDKLIALYK